MCSVAYILDLNNSSIIFKTKGIVSVIIIKCNTNRSIDIQCVQNHNK